MTKCLFPFSYLGSVKNTLTEKTEYLSALPLDIENIEAWVNIITDDAVLMLPGLPAVEGREGAL